MITEIIVKESVRRTLVNETLEFKCAETGGVFCGHYRGDAVVITAASGPGPNATHSLTDFEMDEEFMYQFIARQYEDSDGMNIYIGEWHTHPQKHPVPSEQDYASVSERADEWQHGILIYLIIGFVGFNETKLEDQLITFRFDNGSRELVRLPVRFDSD